MEDTCGSTFFIEELTFNDGIGKKESMKRRRKRNDAVVVVAHWALGVLVAVAIVVVFVGFLR
jgi:hypothetical protein